MELGVKYALGTTSETTVAAIQQLCGNILSALWIPTMSLLHRHFKNKFGHINEKNFYACPEWIMAIMLASTLVLVIKLK